MIFECHCGGSVVFCLEGGVFCPYQSVMTEGFHPIDTVVRRSCSEAVIVLLEADDVDHDVEGNTQNEE